MGYGCRIVEDSLSPMGARLTSFEVTFPRIVLAEFNTHRMFSRNSASSRAIPVEKQIRRVLEDTFFPVHWGKNQKGMQADQELTETEIALSSAVWSDAMKKMVESARSLVDVGVHKQITNRLLEPFMFHTAIVTATEWQNYFNLRCNPQAQPEIRKIAEQMELLYRSAAPKALAPGQWHLPLLEDADLLRAAHIYEEDFIKISVGRCARTSYLTQDGQRDHLEDVNLHNRLLKSGHMSPFEHQAQALSKEEWDADCQKAMVLWRDNGIPMGNFWGFRQYRKTLANEAVFPKA